MGSFAAGFIVGIIPKLQLGIMKLAEEKEVKNREVLQAVHNLRYDVGVMTNEMRQERIRLAQERQMLLAGRR